MALRWRLTAQRTRRIDLPSPNTARLRRWAWRRLVDLREMAGGTNEAWDGFLGFVVATAVGALTVGRFVPTEWGWRLLLAAIIWTPLWLATGRSAADGQRAFGLPPAHPAGWWLIGAGGLVAILGVGLALHSLGLPGWVVVAGGVLASCYAVEVVALVLARVWPAANPMSWYAQAVDADRRRRVWDRRRAMGRTGLAVYVVNHGRPFQADIDGLGEPRRLWRAERPGGDTALVMVEVRNSTPEPDGSRRTYWLRVPPHINTCQAAVAWTFGIESHDDYRLAAES